MTEGSAHCAMKSKAPPKKKSYKPILAIFSVTAILAYETLSGMTGFMGYSLTILALLKLMDLRAFVGSFKKYDIIAKRLTFYGWAYPFLELIVGIGFVGGRLAFTPALSTFLGFIGGVSVIKAVYIDKQDLECACVGGNMNVPLGIVSFIENAMMFAMGLPYLAWKLHIFF